MAAKLAMPRAVGHANGSNPINVALSCHRLIAANGWQVECVGELEPRRWLLQHEGVGIGPRRPARRGIPAGIAVADSGRVCDAL
jgi:alkylated DNA nucleotide flippase Atl1